MPLSSGTRIGPYEIVSPLGAGGMGEVYRARDVRLGRDVAVKALPASAGLDPERIARFGREAQILGGLSHPHIAALYGLEQAASSQFLIMELVEGGTLAARLASGALPMRAAIDFGRQIADALQSAHDRGVIHRDLKPANVGFTADGHVKVLDFGLAKAHTATSDVDTYAAGTQSGVVLGTAAYMSPEQARGMPLDKRSDIFAFGCVLFEMLTGRNPFGAATISDIIVAILSREPDWTLLPPTTPARVQWLLRRCLEKDPRRRLHDMADARIELDEALVNPSDSEGSGAHPAALPTVRPRFSRRELAAWVIAALSLAAGVGAVAVRNRQPATDDTGRTYNALVQLPPLSANAAGNPTASFGVSPDGRQLAFVGPGPDGLTMIWIRPLDSPVAWPLAGTEGGTYPFWSPDSRFVGFIWRAPTNTQASGPGQLKRVESTGGAPVRIADVAFASVASWSPDGVILFTPAGNSSLHRVSAEGGTSTEVTRLDASAGHVQHAHPFFLPDARRFLYTVVGSRTGATATTGIHVASLDASERPRLLVEGASQGAFARGHLFYELGATLMARPFDPARLEFTGTPSPVAERIVTSSSGGGLISAYGVSASGVLAYKTMSPVRSQLAWFDRAAAGKPSRTLGEQGDWADVALSPDGARLATSKADPVSGSRDIWIFDVKRGLPERLTSASSDDFAPVWSPGGDALIFSAARDGGINLFRAALAGGTDRRIHDGGLALGKYAASWSPDGRVLFIAGGRTIARSDLMLLPAEGGDAQVFLDSENVETQGRFSPDGRWIAYASNASGRLEVYIKPYNRAGEAQRVSEAGGRWPRWRRDSGEVVFMSPDDTLMSASLRMTVEDVTVGEIRPLFKVRPRPQDRLDSYPYDMTPDAQHFIVNTMVEERPLPDLLTLIINWRGTGGR